MIAQPVLPDFAPLLDRVFFFDATEGSYEITGIQGKIPGWLRGSYYVNGPARFERAGRRCKNWLDGDGMICALSFTEEGVRYTGRFIETPKLRDERAAGEFLYRGFGMSFPGDRLRRKVMLEPPVNVSIYPYDGRLLAFGEQTLPFELDPVTLETRGEYDFNGSLNEVTPFAAHAKFDGELLNFGVSFSAAKPMLNIYEFNDSGSLLRRKRYEIQMPHSVHDFGFTRRHTVFFLSPLLMNFEPFWNDGASVMESLAWQPEKGSRILVGPRGTNKDGAFFVPAGNGYCLHLINCFEEAGILTVDIIELDRPVYGDYEPLPDLFTIVEPGRPVRYRVDLASKSVIERIPMAYDRTPDFPAIDTALAGSNYDEFWMLGIRHSGTDGRKFFDQLAHGSWRDGDVKDLYTLPAGQYFGGEPVYVPNPVDSGDGVVIVEHLDPAGANSSFWLFDAHAILSGPIARLPLRAHIHPGFHASFWR